MRTSVFIYNRIFVVVYVESLPMPFAKHFAKRFAAPFAVLRGAVKPFRSEECVRKVFVVNVFGGVFGKVVFGRRSDYILCIITGVALNIYKIIQNEN